MKAFKFLLLGLILLISSCNIFKRTSTNQKVKDVLIAHTSTVKKEQELDTSKEMVLDKSQTVSTNNSKIIIYPSKGKPIQIEEDGTITGELDSIFKEVNTKTDEAKNILSELQNNIKKTSDSLTNARIEDKKEEKIKTKIKEPDRWSISLTYAIISITVVIIIIIILRKII